MTGYSVELANSYITGNGADLNPIKGLQILTMLALKDNDKKAISELSDHFYIGDCINKDTERALQLQNLSGGQLDKYKAGNALEFKKPVKKPTDGIFEEEERHLEAVINEIQDDIRGKEKKLQVSHKAKTWGEKVGLYRTYHQDISYMEPEQKDDYLDKKQRDREILVEIRELELISANPYHGRMDLTVNGERRKCYIGDNEYQSKRGNSIMIWTPKR